ncbi:MAG: TraR/DksA family transcriptional regulator [Spirochaetaceae bacterium]|nr:MAG: TraR/DksA family transcriptional regulator [Spirochaetaceae bacterium]
MDKRYLQKMKDTLVDMKKKILQNLASENEEFNELIEDTDPKDLADIAADDIDRKILEALGNVELKTLRLIDSALSRIQNGHYGQCIKCSDKIPKERLDAIPYATLCIKCKSSEELRNR